MTADRHTYLCPMRWGDMDALGHVNNGAYVDYLQEARVDLLFRTLGLRRTAGQDTGLVVTRHEVSYAGQLTFRPEPIPVHLWVSKVGGASFDVDYEIADPGQTYVRARTRLVPFDFAAQTLRRLSPAERAQLGAMLREEAALTHPVPRARAIPPEAEAYAYELAVRWSDMDAYGHANNVAFYDFFQEARIPFLVGILGPELDCLVVRQSVDYLAPVLLQPRPHRVEQVISAIGSSSFEITGELWSGHAPGAKPAARAQTMMVRLDPSTGRPIPLTDAERELLAQWQA